MNDAERLMAGVRARDADAFEALYDQHHRLVYGIALRILGNADSAEDVTQSVFMKLWTSPQLFRSGNFAAWIVRVARNRALDALRARSTIADESVPEEMPADDVLEDLAFAHIDAQHVRAELAKLPNEQREAIEMGFFGGITHEEIARRTGIPLGTIKTRIRSGLHRLRAALDDLVSA